MAANMARARALFVAEVPPSAMNRTLPSHVTLMSAKVRTSTSTGSGRPAYVVSRRERKKVEMLFAHLNRILRLDRLRLRGPSGARDEFHLAAAAQNLRKLAKLLPEGPHIRVA